MRTSPNGIELIKRFEGFSPTPYFCPANYLTIGYGHVITEKDIHITSKKTEISKLQAEEILRKDLIKFENSISKLITASLTQNQFDALVSFTFNLGAGALQRSTLRQQINRCEHISASQEFLKWVYAGGRKLSGLMARRQAESGLYISG
jgi:lysozyme